MSADNFKNVIRVKQAEVNMYDFHMHSGFSSDTDVTMKAMIESGIQKGFKQITFTDHIDYEYNSSEIEFEFDTDHYQQEIEAFRNQYGSQIQINLGLEIGIQPHILDRCATLVEKVKPDFVIASLHNVNKKDLYLGEYYIGKTPEEALQAAFEELESMLNEFSDFCVIGHLDIVKRYDTEVRNLPKEIFLKHAEPVLKKLIAMNRGIEVNTSGLRQGLNETLPSYELLTLYRTLGGELLTIGSDAHQPEDIGHSFEEVLKVLKELGFKHIYTFKQMQPTPIAIDAILADLA